MADQPSDKFPTATPSALAVANAALLAALIGELINSQIVPRESIERVLGTARRDVGRHSTQGAYREAIAFLSSLQERLPKG